MPQGHNNQTLHSTHTGRRQYQNLRRLSDTDRESVPEIAMPPSPTASVRLTTAAIPSTTNDNTKKKTADEPKPKQQAANNFYFLVLFLQ